MSDKLKNVNVPELFIKHFLTGRTGPSDSVLEIIEATKPQKRGRGYTRILAEITEEQWEELYQYAAEARASMSGAERNTVLRAAICGKALATRMEKAGVTNLVAYTPSRTRKPKATSTQTTAAPTAPAATDDSDVDTSLDSVVTPPAVPTEPVTLDTADDLDGAPADELEQFGEDLGFGS